MKLYPNSLKSCLPNLGNPSQKWYSSAQNVAAASSYWYHSFEAKYKYLYVDDIMRL